MNDIIKVELNQKVIEAGMELRFWIEFTEDAFPRETWKEILSRDDTDIDKQDMLYYMKKTRFAKRKYKFLKKQIED